MRHCIYYIEFDIMTAVINSVWDPNTSVTFAFVLMTEYLTSDTRWELTVS